MSDTSKFPFDSVPLDGPAVGLADPPRPSFSRSVPDVSAAGLLPPTRKPVAVTVPDPVPPTTPPAGTPPPNAGSLRGFLWDLVRPTRTKWAILAGGVSLVAGAYGLNLVAPTAPPAAKKDVSEATRFIGGPTPQVVDERQPPPKVDEHRATPLPAPRVDEHRIAAVPPPKEFAPAPLPTPLPTPIVPVRAEEPFPAVTPLKPDVPAPGGPLPVPVTLDKPAPVTPLPTPVMTPVEPTPTPLPLPKFGEKVDIPIKPVEKLEPLPLPPMPVPSDRKPDPLPKPPAFTEAPDPVKVVPIPSPVPSPEVKVTPTPVGLPPAGEVVGPKPVAVAPPSVKPIAIEPRPADVVTPLPVVPVAEKKPTPIPVPAFKEEPATVGVKEPPTPVGSPPPKKGFEVDVVKVRATDTYTSISEAFYQSRKYAAALRAFNGDVDISRLQEVEVPPLFELQKLTGTPREAEPTGRTVIPVRGSTPSEPPVRGPVIEPTGDAGESVDWGPVGKRRAVIKYEKFTTPKEGMTAREVARAVYADENEWSKLIGPRGAKLRADDRLPRGTELTVPREELPWK